MLLRIAGRVSNRLKNPVIEGSAVKNDIGKIANQIMMAVTLRWETILMPEERKEGHQSSVIRFAFQSTDYWKYFPTPTLQ